MKYIVDLQNEVTFYFPLIHKLLFVGGLCSTNEARMPSQMARWVQNTQTPLHKDFFSFSWTFDYNSSFSSPGSETLRTLARVVVECWHHSPPVRLTALRVKKTLARWTQITHTLYFVLWTFISFVSLSGYLASRLKNMKLFLIVSILQTWMRHQSPSSTWQHEQVWACQC